MREILHMVVVLVATSLVSGFALALVNNVTAETIELQILKNKKEPAIQEIMGDFDNDPIGERVIVQGPSGQELTAFPTSRGGTFGGVAIEGVGKGYGGDVAVMVGIGADGKLTGIGIITHSETPGLGARSVEPVFRDQFKGMLWDADKKVGDIEAISGATITSTAVVAAINQATAGYRANTGEFQK